jgi:hypothetical protein
MQLAIKASEPPPEVVLLESKILDTKHLAGKVAGSHKHAIRDALIAICEC